MTAATLPDQRRRFGVFERDDELAAEHEQVVFCHDEPTGLKAIIAIHNTALGPALGGTRCYPYKSEADALTDVLRLSRGMTFKAAAAGMPLGGGKAVLIGDPGQIMTAELLRAYGRFIESLGGRYITAADVGTGSRDLDVVGEVTRYVVGRSPANGGSGDSGWSTAYGVFCAMKTAAETLWGPEGLSGKTIGVEGLGKVGFHLVGLLVAHGAKVVVSDPSAGAVKRLVDVYGPVPVVADVVEAAIDIYAPCALGATLTPRTVSALTAVLVCGAANNQLATPDVDAMLATRGVLWIPDFLANAGGLIQVGSELQDRSPAAVRSHIEGIGSTVSEILAAARHEGLPTGVCAARIVESRLTGASR